jgi:HEAT repeat protein
MRCSAFLALLLPLGLLAAEWTPLFDGKTLAGWTRAGHVNGAAEYTVEEGCIVGTTKTGTPNSFLCADQEYGNFILELEFLVPQGMNSGVQFRSIYDPQVKDGRVHGYQIEIDPSPRAWTGGIYDEARRGWLHNLTHIADPAAAGAAKAAFKAGEWNHFRIEAVGDRIRTWVNGVPVADLVDGMTRRGVIALQVHATGDPNPMQIRWRNLRIQDLGEGGTTRDLLGDPAEKMGMAPPPGATVLVGGDGNVESLRAQNKTDAPFPWKVADGVLEIVPGSGSVVTRENYGDFRMHAEFSVNAKEKHSQDDGNSGIYIQQRYEVQILNSHGLPPAFDECGALYRLKAPDHNASRPAGEWQSYDLVFRSPRWSEDGKTKTANARISISHNGILIHDNAEIPGKTGAGQAEGPEPGPILFQDHGNPVRFRNVWIEELRTIDRAMSVAEEQQHAEAERWRALRAYTFGDSREPLLFLENQARSDAAETRRQLEAGLLAVLDDPAATEDGKLFACQLLVRVGSPAAVPALARMLALPRLGDRACIALAAIPGGESLAALRDGLALDLPDPAKGAVMNALAERADAAAVPRLLPFLTAANPLLARHALAALGTIGGAEAVAGIRQANLPAEFAEARAEALLGCASRAIGAGDTATAEALLAERTGAENTPRIRLAAYSLLCRLRGDRGSEVVLALLAMPESPLRDLGARLVADLPGGAAATAALCAGLPALPPASQTLLAAALAERGDRAAVPALLPLLGQDGPMQAAAIAALGQLGDASCVPPLLALASGEGAAAGPARAALARLPDRAADPVLVAILEDETPLPAKLAAVNVLTARGCTAAIPALAATIVKRADAGLVRDCWRALRDLAPGENAEFARLLELLPAITASAELREAERTLAAVADKLADETERSRLLLATLERTAGAAKATAVALAGRFPAAASLAALQAALKDPEEAVRYAAVKALMEWPDDAPAASLLDFARETGNEAHHALALRGYVRLVTLKPQPEAELKPRLDAALAVARRDAEKELITEAATALRVSELKAKSGKPYELVPKGFVKDGLVYIDREYVFVEIPPFLANADLIKTAMVDRGSTAPDQTTFHISRPATVIVCYDNRARTRPEWLKDWQKLEDSIATTDRACRLDLYAKRFPAGLVEINGNSPVPNVSANHILGVTAAPLP